MKQACKTVGAINQCQSSEARIPSIDEMADVLMRHFRLKNNGLEIAGNSVVCEKTQSGYVIVHKVALER